MTNEEKAIMGDMFYFLRDHDDPPAAGTEASAEFWEKATKDIAALVGVKWKNHPLAIDMGVALYGYLEKKSKGGGSA